MLLSSGIYLRSSDQEINCAGALISFGYLIDFLVWGTLGRFVTVFTSQRTAPVNARLSSLSTKKLIIQ